MDIVDIMRDQVKRGMMQTRKDLQRSRGMLQRMSQIPEADLSNVWNTSLLIADSNPSAERTWKVEPEIFLAIARVHWKQWDMKSHAKQRIDLGSLVENFLGRLQNWQVQYMTRVYSTMGHGIVALYHDSLSKETVDPLYFRTKGTYPSHDSITTENETNTNDKWYRRRLQDVLFHFRLTQNTSFTVSRQYCSTQYLGQVFTEAGLTSSEADAFRLMNTIRFDWSHYKRRNRASGKGYGCTTLGRDLHTVHNIDVGDGTNRQALIVALIADFASFHGKAGWVWFNSMLVQGAWPWLGGYSKSYAKTVLTAMACLFCCVRHGYIWDGVGALILRLASKLVDSNGFHAGKIKVRGSGRLAGKKVLYKPLPKTAGDKKSLSENFDELRITNKNQAVTDVVGTSIDQRPQSWTRSTPTPHAEIQQLAACRFIIPGQPCNHSPELQYTGRITLVSSIAELESACNICIAAHPMKPTIIVSKTYGDTGGQMEVEIYLRREKLLSVRRDKKQCIACAIRLAHLVGAIAVVI